MMYLISVEVVGKLILNLRGEIKLKKVTLNAVLIVYL